jgi:hypothetical protein
MVVHRPGIIGWGVFAAGLALVFSLIGSGIGAAFVALAK